MSAVSPLLGLQVDEGDRHGQEGKWLEGQREPEPPPGCQVATLECGDDAIEHRSQGDQALRMPAHRDGWQRDSHRAEDDESATDVLDVHALEPAVCGTDGECHCAEEQWSGHPERRRVQHVTRIRKRQAIGQPGNRSGDHLKCRRRLECPVEDVEMPVTTGKGRICRVGPVLPEVTEGCDPPPLAKTAHDGRIEHGERHGAHHGNQRDPKRHPPASERLSRGVERSSPGPASACAPQ